MYVNDGKSFLKLYDAFVQPQGPGTWILFRKANTIVKSPYGTSSGLGGSRMGNQGLLGAQGILGTLSLEYHPSLAA